MTRFIILSVCFLALFFLLPGTAKPEGHHAPSATENAREEGKSSAETANGKSIPVYPASKGELPHGTKATAPHMEELPHIHRFHKERVKKTRQHHTRFWMLSKVIVVLCHLSILVIAYLHAIH